MIDLQENVLLRDLTTFKIGLGRARYLTTITERQQVPELYQRAQELNLPVVILGEGSNSIAPDQDLGAIVALNRIKGIEQLNETELRAGAGEFLDDLVAYATERGLCGIESLSGVPGSVGAAPIQNVGAYGQDISQVLIELEAFDTVTGEFVVLNSADCGFTYRESIFKQQAKGRYFITSVTVKLHHKQPQPPFYTSLQNYIEQHHLTDFSPAKLRQYILAVRGSKIPDYHQVPSAGSFFKNALITKSQLDDIEKNFGTVPFAEPIGDLIKIPTGWMIDQAGLRGRVFHGVKIDDNNALILLNDSAKTFADLAQAVAEIQQIIKDKFGVAIEQEPINITASGR